MTTMTDTTDKTADTEVITVTPEEEMTEEELQALKESEDFIANFKDEDLEDPVKSAELAEKLKSAKTTIAQKRHYRDKVQELTKVTPPTKPAVTPPVKPADDGKKEISAAERVEFRQDHPELSREVVKAISEHAVAYGKTLEEAFKMPIIQKYIRDVQDAEDVEGASVQPTRRPASGVADKDWSTASKEDMDKQRLAILHPNG